MKSTIQITDENKEWLRRGVIKELIEKYQYKKSDAINLFNNSPLLKIFHNDPKLIFHHSPSHWADFLIKLINMNLFEDFTCGDYNSKDDDEFQEMKYFYERMPEEEKLSYKKDLYEDMVED